VKTWIAISLGIHVAAFGAFGGRPAPSRNLIPPGRVYSVSLVSMPVVRRAPAAEAPAEKKVEAVRPEPRPAKRDEKAVKPPPREQPEKTEPKKPEPKEAEPEPERPAPQEEPSGSAQASGADSAGTGGSPVAVSSLGGTETRGTVSLDAANFGFSYYLVGLQAKVASNWFPPGSVGAPGEVLRATIHFRVMSDGSIEDSVVERSSGVPYFDRCALRAILLSSPLAPLPSEYDEDELGVHFEFSHTVNPR